MKCDLMLVGMFKNILITVNLEVAFWCVAEYASTYKPTKIIIQKKSTSMIKEECDSVCFNKYQSSSALTFAL